MKHFLWAGLSLIILEFFVGELHSQTLFINEIMSANASTLQDEDGEASDWIELYNSGEIALNLKNYHLSDDLTQPAKWTFPDVAIPGKGFLLIFASDKDRTTDNLHTNFKIKSEGEPLVLTDPSGIIVDQFPAVELANDVSWGREVDGGNTFAYFTSPTPLNPNQGGSNPPLQEIEFSHESGWFVGPFELTLFTNGDVQIFYTLDGSIPGPTSQLYQGPIKIEDISDQSNGISMTPNTAIDWNGPKDLIHKTPIIRAIAFRNGTPVSSVYSHIFFFKQNSSLPYSLPVVSLITDPDNLFGYESGIYVNGRNFDEYGYPNYTQGGNLWERPANFVYLNENGALDVQQEIGIRISGRGSRQNPQKSLRLYARKEYGEAKFEYPFFKNLHINSFKRLVLRSPLSGWSNSGIRDGLAHTIVQEMNLETQAYQPTIVYINGEYWGIYNLRERQDKHFLESYFNIDPDSVEILENQGISIEGSPQNYRELIAYIEANDLSDPVHFSWVSERIDLDNLIDYLIANVFFENHDWPFHNFEYWRSAKKEGKWRWLFFDLDGGLYRYGDDWLSQILNQSVPALQEKPWSTLLIRRLWENKDFRDRYHNQFLFHLSTTFSPTRTVPILDSLQSLYEPVIFDHIQRWESPKSVGHWKLAIEDMRTFLFQRPLIVLENLQEAAHQQLSVFPNPTKGNFTFSLKNPIQTTYQVSLLQSDGRKIWEKEFISQSGKVSIDIEDYPKGIYFLQVMDGAIRYAKIIRLY